MDSKLRGKMIARLDPVQQANLRFLVGLLEQRAENERIDDLLLVAGKPTDAGGEQALFGADAANGIRHDEGNQRA